jgi:branched-chain amino acid transport system substrate-binding protein
VKRRILAWVLPAAVVGAALVAAGAATGKIAGPSSAKHASTLPASSCGPVQYGGSGSPKFIIPSDLPLQGSSRSQTIEMTKAIAFTLKNRGYKAGKYTVGYQSCDDSTAQAGKWDPAKCSGNAGLYSRDKQVIAVIGTFNSGCAEIEVPVSNRVGLQYLSPANTYIGLTHRPALPGEPQKYYPTGKRTYARVVAADDFQASADLLLMKKTLHKKSVYILNDKEAYGFGIASALRNVAKKSKLLKVAGFAAWDGKAASYEDIATKISNSGADTVFLGGVECLNGGKLIKDIRAGNPNITIVGPDGFSSFKDTIKDAGSASNGMWISIAGQPFKFLGPTGKAFARSFGKSIGLTASKVNPYSNYGATAMSVMLNAVAKSGGTRAGVTANIYNRCYKGTAIGNFCLNKNGDTNAGTISFYKVVGQDAPFVKIITPPASLVAQATP